MDDQNRADQPLPEPQQPPQPPQPQTPQPPQAPNAPEPPQPAAAPAPAPQAPQAPYAPEPQPAAQSGYPYQQSGGQPYYQQPAPQSNGKAIGALVCGILAILFSWLPLIGIILGIVAIVLAVKAVKESGKDGKTTGGKVCGIIGIVLSVLAFMLYFVIGLGLLAFMAADDSNYSYSSSSGLGSGSSATPAPDSSSATESEQAMQDALSAQLDKLQAKDAAVVQMLAAKADEELADATGYSLTDLGVDPALFVEWMLTDFSYEPDSALDFGDGTGSAYANVTLRDSMAFATAFVEDAQAAIDAGQMDVADEASAKALLGELYEGAMAKTTAMATDYISVEMQQVGGTWRVDEDSWESELDYLFGL